jgi:hypothetical protein
MKLSQTFILIGAVSTMVNADMSDKAYVCESNGSVRLISVEYERASSSVPCRVVYEKTNENLVEYPWRARTERGYCEKKAEFLANKLSRLGWHCEAQSAKDEKLELKH